MLKARANPIPRPIPMLLFAAVSLGPLVLLAGGIVAGGVWALAGLVYMSMLAATLDQVTGQFIGNAEDGVEFPAADGLLVVIVIAHCTLLPMAVFAIAADSGLSGLDRVLLFAGCGLWFGQVAIPAAHELIHRGNRHLFHAGGLIYASLLFGHHTSAHRLVHHRHAASDADPNSARSGEGFYAFAARAWIGSFRKGWRAENALRAKASAAGVHPYAVYIGVALISLVAAGLIAGWAGVAVWAGLAVHAQTQLLLSDYVQHYGLTRVTRPDGKLEPVADRHSWNTAHWFTSSLMLNAPRHSDHHAHPARAFPALRLPDADQAPRLPWSLPVACTIALIPPVWKRAIRPHLARWRTAAGPKS